MLQTFKINAVRIDGGTQQRVDIPADVIEDYAAAPAEAFPPGRAIRGRGGRRVALRRSPPPRSGPFGPRLA